MINLSPTVISVLIGVNDTWHEFGSQNGVAVPKYERVYRDFLEEVSEALPGVEWVLCEPFVLDCGVVVEGWREEIDQRRAVVAKVRTHPSTPLPPLLLHGQPLGICRGSWLLPPPPPLSLAVAGGC